MTTTSFSVIAFDYGAYLAIVVVAVSVVPLCMFVDVCTVYCTYVFIACTRKSHSAGNLISLFMHTSPQSETNNQTHDIG